MNGHTHSSVLGRPSWTPASRMMLQRRCACGKGLALRDCESCSEKRSSAATQAVDGLKPAELSPIVQEVLKSTGSPLDPQTRALMEPRFGRDLRDVKIHRDERAASSAETIDAEAYTVGNHIVFGSNAHSPNTANGRKLIAHELTHVVQQTPPGASAADASAVSKLELEAERVSDDLGTDRITPVTGQGPTAIARQPTAEEENRRRKQQQELNDLEVQGWLSNSGQTTSGAVTRVQSPPPAEKVDVMSKIIADAKDRAAGVPAPKLPLAPLATLLPPPRTQFEARARKESMHRITHEQDGGRKIVGYWDEHSGLTRVYDLDGNIVFQKEKPLETPLLDPIDFIPVELIGSLASKAVQIGARAAVKGAARLTGKIVVEEVTEIGGKAITSEFGQAGVKQLASTAEKKMATSAGAEGSASLDAAATKAAARTPADELEGFRQMLRAEGASGEITSGELIELGPHGAAPRNRAALGVSGKEVQSAHGAPQSVMRGVAGYNPRAALTRLMDRAAHTEMDQYWKQTFQSMRRSGQKTATAQRIFDVTAESIRRATSLPAGERESLIARLSDEMFVEFGLKPNDLLDLPYANLSP